MTEEIISQIPTLLSSKPQTKPKKPRLNALDGKTWTKYSISIWDIAKTQQEIKLKHPALFPTELCRRLIDIYTKEGDTVIDPFVGSGSTVVAAEERSRVGIGLDINQKFVKLSRSRLGQTLLFDKKEGKLDTESAELKSNGNSKIFLSDAIHLLEYVPRETVDFCITSPPYWNILQRRRSADYKKPRPYSTLQRDLGNIDEYKVFMRELERVFEPVYHALKTGKHCALIVGDIRIQSNFIPYHFDIAEMMKSVGFIFEDIIIWDRHREYNMLRPLGYPYAFIVNKIHEYILIFRK